MTREEKLRRERLAFLQGVRIHFGWSVKRAQTELTLNDDLGVVRAKATESGFRFYCPSALAMVLKPEVTSVRAMGDEELLAVNRVEAVVFPEVAIVQTMPCKEGETVTISFWFPALSAPPSPQ